MSSLFFLELLYLISYFWMNSLFSFPWTGKCGKLYLQPDLILLPLRIDIGVRYRSQKESPEVFYKKTVLENFAIFTGKHLYWSLFLIKLQALRLGTLLNRRHQHRCFPANIGKVFRTPILKNLFKRLLLRGMW